MNFLENKIIANRYHIEEKLGQGGMGSVFKGKDLKTDKTIAIKLIEKDYHSPEDIKRFEREAKIGFSLDHPHIIKYYDSGFDGQFYYLVMEFIDGYSIKEWVEKNTPDIKTLYNKMKDIVSAIAYAHEKDIIHRDIKPENIMITKDGIVKILDFGLARRLNDTIKLTQTGTIMGTILYMSPEQSMGQRGDKRSDLYSLGIVFYELLTGRLLFQDSEPLNVIFQQINEKPDVPSKYNPDIPKALDKIIMRLLKKNPEQRYQSARELLNDLEALKLEENKDLLTESSFLDADIQSNIHNIKLVGRQKELTRLNQLYQKSLFSKSQSILISGPLGIGKTKLIKHFSNFITINKGKYLYTQCNEQDKVFQPVANLINLYLTNNKTTLNQILHKDDLFNIKSIIKLQLDEILTKSKKRSKETLNIIFNSILNFFKTIQNNGIALVFDDIQYADKLTLSFIDYLITSLKDEKIFVILNLQDDIPKDNIKRELKKLLKNRKIEKLKLEPLNIEETKSLIINYFSVEDLSPAGLNTIYKISEGNPLFIIELIDALKKEDILYIENNFLQYLPIPTKTIPESLENIILIKLEDLDEDSLKVLITAAVIGKAFTIELLSEITEFDLDEIEDILQEAIELKLIEEVWTTGKDQYSFINNLTQQVLYLRLAERKRKRLHKKIAQAIEELYEDEIQEHLEELVYHYEKADIKDKLFNYTYLLAKKYSSIYSYEQAEEEYEKALNIYKENKLTYPIKLYDIYYELGFIAYSTRNEYDKALKYYTDALVIVEKYNIKDKLPEIYYKIAHMYVYKKDFANANKYIQLGLNTVDMANQKEIFIDLMSSNIVVKNSIGDYKKALEIAFKALNTAKQLSGDYLARIYIYMAQSYLNLSDIQKAIKYFQDSLDISEDVKLKLYIYQNLVYIADFIEGNYKKACSLLESEVKLSRKTKMNLSLNLQNLGYHYFKLGKWDSAEEVLKESLELEEKGSFNYCFSYHSLADIYLYQGKIDKAEKMLLENVKYAQDTNNIRALADTYISLVELYIQKDNIEEARKYLSKLKEFTEKFNDIYYKYTLLDIDILLKEDSPKKAELKLNSINIDDIENKEIKGQFYLSYAKVLNYQNKKIQAQDNLLKAINIFNELSLQYELSYSYYLLARITTNIDYYDNSLKIALSLGAKSLVEKIKSDF